MCAPCAPIRSFFVDQLISARKIWFRSQAHGVALS